MNNYMRLLFIALFAIMVLSACGQSEEPARPRATHSDNHASTDTTRTQLQPEAHPQEVTESGAGQSEIESRLEALVSLIEQKETALMAREQDVLKREQNLVAETSALDKRVESVNRLQRISWILIGVGGITFVVGLVMAARSRKDIFTEPGNSSPAAVRTSTIDPKSSYVQKIEAQFKEWETKIDELKAKAAKAGDDVKDEYQKQTNSLSRKLRSTGQKFQELKEAPKDTWQDLKAGMDKAASDMNDAIAKATDKIK